jgi:hypothetical protein
MGHYRFGTVDIPASRLAIFSTRMQERMADIPEFKNAFFVHELRGSKGECPHDFDIVEDIKDAIDNVTSWIDPHAINLDDWYIDVALEVREPERVLQWTTDGHREILKLVLPTCSDERLDRVLERSYKTFHDLSSSLVDLGGLWCIPNSTDDDELLYVNAYTTDKTVSYQLHKGIWTPHTAASVLPQNFRRLDNDIGLMMDTLIDCAKASQESCVRLEIRVPLSRATTVLRTIDQDFLNKTVVTYNPYNWW